MRHTKILATLGPATEEKSEIRALVQAGMDIVRLNFSHGNHEYFGKLFNTIQQVCEKKSLPIATLVDLQGPKIRIGELSEDEITIKSGEMIEITTKKILGTKNKLGRHHYYKIDLESPFMLWWVDNKRAIAIEVLKKEIGKEAKPIINKLKRKIKTKSILKELKTLQLL